MFVYVLNCHGQPLMPCQPRKARILLKAGKAKVKSMVPFTIRLLYGSSSYTQEISLGIDAGTQHIGVSATTEKVVLFEADVSPRTDIPELLATRRQFRRARRTRTTRYRKARFDNRRRSQSWLAPSVQHKVDVHLKTIKRLHHLLPVSKTTIEVAQFDIQKINHPEIEGKAYQQGPQLGFQNVREYVLWRDGHSCQWCKGNSKDRVLNVHHIESRKTGGDSPDNLITLCETCHDLIHRTHLEEKITRKRTSFRGATQMGIIRCRIYEESKVHFPNVHLTYGYITKSTRMAHRLEKSHTMDARCISGNPCARSEGTSYLMRWVRRNNRQLHKATISKRGQRRRNTASKYVQGFRLFDCVRYQGKPCFVWGRRRSGYFDLRALDGTRISAGASCKKLTNIQRASACLVEMRSDLPLVA